MPMTIEPTQTDEAVTLIDRFLADIRHQNLVTSTDATDFALDLRLLLASAPPAPQPTTTTL